MEPLGPMEDWLYDPDTAEALRTKPDPPKPRERPLLTIFGTLVFGIAVFGTYAGFVMVIQSLQDGVPARFFLGMVVAIVGIITIWMWYSINRRLRKRV